MATVTYIEHDGSEHAVELAPGTTVMQGALDHSVNGIVGDCGGACACATCHCYVDPAWLGKLDPPGESEAQMLECAIDPEDNSRLSCQIDVTAALDGLIVRLPESQF